MDGLKVGSLVGGRFRVERLIGEGGMCLVYAAQHMLTRKHLALKVLRRAHAASPSTRRRFLREARAACAVRHPNVLEIDDVLELEDSTLVLVMDRLEGEPLSRKLARSRRLLLAELAPIVIQVIDAMTAAHAMGIVHRDLKPENIFVVPNPPGPPGVKVIDFGIAKLTASGGDAARTDTETGQGDMLGTPYYMAPEQVLGDVDLDHRADIWALGVILYEALAGVRPIDGDTVAQILLRVTRGTLVPLQQRAPQVPRRLGDVITRMLSVDRDDRPSDLRELRRILLASMGADAATMPAAAAPSNRTPTQRPVAVSVRPAKVTPDRWSGLAPALGAVTLLVLGLAAMQATRSDGSSAGGPSGTSMGSVVGAERAELAAAVPDDPNFGRAPEVPPRAPSPKLPPVERPAFPPVVAPSASVVAPPPRPPLPTFPASASPPEPLPVPKDDPPSTVSPDQRRLPPPIDRDNPYGAAASPHAP